MDPRAVNFKQMPSDKCIVEVLEKPVEIDMATSIVKNLSRCLILQMRRSITGKLKCKGPTMAEIETQLLQVQTAEQVLKLDRQEKQPPLLEALKTVEQKLSREAEAAKLAAAEAAKPKAIIRDGKKLLEVYKAAKAKEEKKDTEPLEMLRDFFCNKKDIVVDKKTIWFGDIGFPKTVKTNFKSCIGKESYYTLDTLLHFVQYRCRFYETVSAGIYGQNSKSVRCKFASIGFYDFSVRSLSIKMAR
jgi:hypothetical protein